MRPAEVLLLWARVAPVNAAGRSLAATQIDLAASLEPDSAEVAYLRGCLARVLGHDGEATTAFRSAVNLAPRNPRYLLGLVVALSSEAFGSHARAPETLRTYEALAAVAASPEQQAMVSRFQAATGYPDEALQRAASAVRSDWRCLPCAYTLAELRAARGDTAGAIAVLERTRSASHDARQDQAILAALEKYRRPSSTPRK